MNINATFLIQIANFWITYFVLHKLLLKPFITIIDKKKAAREQLLCGLKEKAQKNTYLQERKKKNLEEFQDLLSTQYIFRSKKMYKVPAEVFFIRDQNKINELITQQASLLIRKAPLCILK